MLAVTCASKHPLQPRKMLAVTCSSKHLLQLDARSSIGNGSRNRVRSLLRASGITTTSPIRTKRGYGYGYGISLNHRQPRTCPRLLYPMKGFLSDSSPSSSSLHCRVTITGPDPPQTVGAIILVALTGLVVLMLLFVAVTLCAMVVSIVVSLAAAGGFFLLLFAFLTAIFAISTLSFSAILPIIITTGWIGVFRTGWLVTTKRLAFAIHSLSVTGSILLTYAAAWGARNHVHKDSDLGADHI